MLFTSWLRNGKRPAPTVRRRTQTSPRQRAAFRPRLEALEDRTLPSGGLTFLTTVNNTQQLIDDINYANQNGGTYTIKLSAPATNGTFDLTAVDNTTNGANGLPVISGGSVQKKGAVAAVNLTIIGEDSGGDTIQRDLPALGMSAFRLFDVAPGASLTLENVTLTGGWAYGSGAGADGGGIYNQGTLTLNCATVQNNHAEGSSGAGAAAHGGGIYNQGTLILNGATVQGNGAGGSFGANGGDKNGQKYSNDGQAGADAAGGGIWSSGSVTLQDLTQNGTTIHPLLQGNWAGGGRGGAPTYFGVGGAGGSGFGGGLYEAGGSVYVSNATISGNGAAGGSGGSNWHSYPFSNGGAGGNGSGGALYVAGGTLTLSNVTTVASNQALGGFGGSSYRGSVGAGGDGSGGGIYVAADGTVAANGMAAADGTTTVALNLSANTAKGGAAGQTYFGGGDAWTGGAGLGGGLYVANGGTVTLSYDTVTGNNAYGGLGDVYGSAPAIQYSGSAAGAGIYIAGGTVSLDSYTVANTTQNYDYDYYWVSNIWIWKVDNIEGSYTLT